MMKKTMLSMAVVLMLALQACQQAAPPPPPEPLPPPEPTPEQIAAEIRPILEPMKALLRDTGSKESGAGFLNPETEKQVLDALSAAKAQQQKENGKAALNMVTHDIEEIASQARDKELWHLTMGAIKAFELLQPGNTKMARLKDRAALWCKAPIAHLKGFLEDKETGETYAFIEVELLPSHEIKQRKVRKGEEFDNLRFLDTIGKNEGVILEYTLVPGHTHEFMGPKFK